MDLPPTPFKNKQDIGVRPKLDYHNARVCPDPAIYSVVIPDSPEISPVTNQPPDLTSISLTSETSEKLSAGILSRKKQKILVVRHVLTSFTTATFITDDTANDLKDGLLLCCLPFQFS